MKERKISLSKRLMAIVLCVCMMAVSFGTVVFATEGTTTDDGVLVNVDFSTWTDVEKNTKFSSTELALYSGGDVTGASNTSFKLNDDNSLTAYLPYNPDATGQQNWYSYVKFGDGIAYDEVNGNIVFNVDIKKEQLQVPETDEDGAVKTDDNGNIIFKDGTSSGARREFGFYYESETGSKKHLGLQRYQNNGTFRYLTDNSASWNMSSGDGGSMSATPVDGYWSLKFVITKGIYEMTSSKIGTAATYNWRIQIYDKNDSDKLIYTHYALKDETTIGNTDYKDNLPEISGFWIGGYSAKTDIQASESRFTIKNPNAVIEKFKALDTDDSKIFYDNGSITISFNNDLDVTTVTGITMVDANGNNVPINVTADGTTATITPLNALVIGNNYSINVSESVRDANGFGVEPKIFSVQADDEIFDLNFADWTVGETEVSAVAAKTDGVIADYTTSTLSVVTEDNTNVLNTANGTMYMKFPKHIDYDTVGEKITVNVKVRKNENNGGTPRFGWYSVADDGSLIWTPAMHLQSDGKAFRVTSTSCGYGWLDEYELDNNGDGWLDLTFVLETGYIATQGSADKVDYEHWRSSVYNNETGSRFYFISYNKPNTANWTLTSLDGFGILTSGETTNLSVESVSAEFERVKSISCSEKVYFDNGSITIDFNRDMVATYVTENTTINNITVVDAGGNPVEYAATASGASAILTFGQLNIGETYTVTIPGTVKTADRECVLPTTYTFTVTDVVAELDFADWIGTEGITAVDNKNATNGMEESAWFDADTLAQLSDGVMTGSSHGKYQLNEDGSLSGYQAYGTTSQTGVRFTIPLGKTITPDSCEDKITMTVKIKKEGQLQDNKFSTYPHGESSALAAYTSGTMYKSDGTTQTLGGVGLSITAIGTSTSLRLTQFSASSGTIGRTEGTTPETAAYTNNTGTNVSDYTIDEDGYYNLRVELAKETITTSMGTYTWVVRIYDNVTDLLLYRAGLLKDVDDTTSTSGKAALADITALGIGTQMNGSAAPFMIQRVTIKEPKVTMSKFNAEKYSQYVYYKNGKIYIDFTRVIDDTTIEGITLTDTNGNIISTTPETVAVGSDSTNKRRVVLTVNDTLEKGVKYTVNIPESVKSTGGELVNATSFEVESGLTMIDLDFSGLEEKIYLSNTVDAIHESIGSTSSVTINASNQTGTTYRTGNGSLRFWHTPLGGSNYEYMTFYLPNELQTGTYAVEYIIDNQAVSGSGYRQILVGSNSVANSSVSNKLKGESIRSYYSGVKGHSYSDTVTLQPDAENNLHFKVVVSRTEATQNWVGAIYDLNSEQPYYPVVFTKLGNGTSNLSNLGLSAMRDSSRSDTEMDFSFYIKSIKIYEVEDNGSAAWAGVSGSNKEPVISGIGTSNVISWKGELYGRADMNGEYPIVILAAYDDDKLLGAQTYQPKQKETATITLTLPEGVIASSARLFFIDDQNNVTPLADSVTLKNQN